MIIKKENHLSSHITNASLSEIVRQLKYKTTWRNKKLYQVNEYYPSSQLCNYCNTRNKDVKNFKIREQKCKKCYNINERNINASLNILDGGLKMYSKELVM